MTPTAPARALISLQGAGVRFGDHTALQSIDLVLLKGERLALIGSNGSGKTTLLRLLHGLLPASDGRREVQPVTAGGSPPRMPMLFQKPFLLNLSVRRNLLLGLWLQGVPRDERQARADDEGWFL